MALNRPMAHWRARTVWLVGASSGIGLACAAALHAQGANVVLSARNAGALADFVAGQPSALILGALITIGMTSVAGAVAKRAQRASPAAPSSSPS